MPSLGRPPVRPVSDRDGFTVIELLVALVLSGIVVGAIFQLLVGQGRFFEMQSAREEVQQNTRAAIELIGSELRTLPAGDALVRAASDSITIRAARVWGVVCQVNSATSYDVAFSSTSGTSWSVGDGTGAVFNVGSAEAPTWTGGVSVATVGAASGSCNGEALASGIERRTLSLGGTPQNGATTPSAGSVVYLYDQVTYRSGTSAGVPGTWIQRRLGEGGAANQPMAGPVAAPGGLLFQYFSGNSDVPIATPITDAGVRSSVNRIVVVVESVSRNSLGGAPESKADTVIVPLRNRTL